MESRAPCACRDGVAHTAARGPSCVALDLPTLLSPKASLRRSPPLACTALPAPSALERCSQGRAKRPFIFLIRGPVRAVPRWRVRRRVCLPVWHRLAQSAVPQDTSVALPSPACTALPMHLVLVRCG